MHYSFLLLSILFAKMTKSDLGKSLRLYGKYRSIESVYSIIPKIIYKFNANSELFQEDTKYFITIEKKRISDLKKLRNKVL